MFQFFESHSIDKIALMNSGNYNPYREFNQFINELFYTATNLKPVSHYINDNFSNEVSYYAETYVRDLVAGTIV